MKRLSGLALLLTLALVTALALDVGTPAASTTS